MGARDWVGMPIDEVSREIIGAAIEVHRYLGPGLLEATYEECLCREFALRGISFERQKMLALEYKGLRLEDKHRIDLVVARRIPVELKAVEQLLPAFEAQLTTYLRLGGWSLGLLINFGVPVLIDGVRRRVWQHHA